MRIAAIAVAAALLVGGGAYVALRGRAEPPARDQARTLRVDSTGLTRTVVVATDGAPMPEGKNVLWCASFQLAWDAYRLAFGPPAPWASAPAAEIAELNGNPFPPGDLDPRAFVAVAGVGRDRIAERFREAARTTLGESPDLDLPPVAPDAPAAFAMLKKRLAFEPRFERCSPLAFAGGGHGVRAFGIRESSATPSLLERVRVHVAEPPRWPERFVVEIAVAGGEDRLLLARIDPAPTLRETWERTREASQGEGDTAEEGTVLGIPMLDFDIAHRFRELEGDAPTALEAALQRTRFRLDETGATLWSIAAATEQAMSARLVFDRPFLLALIQRGATRPYLLLWIANDELLVPD